MKKYNSYLVCAKTHVEIVTQTLLNQLGVAGKNTLLSFNNEKVEANFSKLYCSSTYLTKKCVKPILIHPQKALFVELAARLNISHSRVVVLRQHY